MNMATDLAYLCAFDIDALYHHCTDSEHPFRPTCAQHLLAQPLLPLVYGRYEYQGQPITAIARTHGSQPDYHLFFGDAPEDVEVAIALNATRDDAGAKGGRQEIRLVPSPSIDELCAHLPRLPEPLYQEAMTAYDTTLRRLMLPLLDQHSIWLGAWNVQRGRDYGEVCTNQYKLWCKLFGEPYMLDDNTYTSYYHLGLQREIGLRVSAYMDAIRTLGVIQKEERDG